MPSVSSEGAMRWGVAKRAVRPSCLSFMPPSPVISSAPNVLSLSLTPDLTPPPLPPLPPRRCPWITPTAAAAGCHHRRRLLHVCRVPHAARKRAAGQVDRPRQCGQVGRGPAPRQEHEGGRGAIVSFLTGNVRWWPVVTPAPTLCVLSSRSLTPVGPASPTTRAAVLEHSVA